MNCINSVLQTDHFFPLRCCEPSPCLDHLSSKRFRKEFKKRLFWRKKTEKKALFVKDTLKRLDFYKDFKFDFRVFSLGFHVPEPPRPTPLPQDLEKSKKLRIKGVGRSQNLSLQNPTSNWLLLWLK
jgi:hypothetical protein